MQIFQEKNKIFTDHQFFLSIHYFFQKINLEYPVGDWENHKVFRPEAINPFELSIFTEKIVTAATKQVRRLFP
jgi:hypothetical protein